MALFALLGFSSGCVFPEPWKASKSTRSLEDLQAQISKFNAAICIPRFEATPMAIRQTATNAIQEANAALDAIARLRPQEMSFANTARALDEERWNFRVAFARLALINEAHTNAAMRAAASESVKAMQSSAVEADYRQDIYEALKTFADTKPDLDREDAQLLRVYLRHGKRIGLDLPEVQRQKLRTLQRRLGDLEIDFSNNLKSAEPTVKFKKAELEGIPRAILRRASTKTGEDEYTVKVAPYLQNFARREETRKRIFIALASQAADKNSPILQQMLECRNEIAQQLGYASWADYETRRNMAASVAAVRTFCQSLATNLHPKFEARLEELARFKAKDTANVNARIEIWDVGYYSGMLAEERHDPDLTKLRNFCPSDRVMKGIAATCERVFGVKIESVAENYQWAPGVELFAVSDSRKGEPLGLIYLDPDDRPGKIAETATATLVPGGELAGGKRQCPVSVVYLHFPRPTKFQRLFLAPGSVESIFHEFGHALHETLSRTKYHSFSGNNVEPDFVEVPSELFKRWSWNKEVLDTFATDGFRKIPPDLFEALQASRAENAPGACCWSLAWALTDLTLHSEFTESTDCIKLSNRVFGENYLPVPEGTALASESYLLLDYDASSYSYLWAEVIAADIASAFEAAPHHFLDSDLGMRLRHELYESGAATDSNEVIRRFLGRPYSTDAFYKELGIQKN